VQGPGSTTILWLQLRAVVLRGNYVVPFHLSSDQSTDEMVNVATASVAAASSISCDIRCLRRGRLRHRLRLTRALARHSCHVNVSWYYHDIGKQSHNKLKAIDVVVDYHELYG
jgi:hypothetical protein